MRHFKEIFKHCELLFFVIYLEGLSSIIICQFVSLGAKRKGHHAIRGIIMMQVVTNSSQGNYQTCIAVKWEKIPPPSPTSFYDLQESAQRGFALVDDAVSICIIIMHLEFGLLWIILKSLFCGGTITRNVWKNDRTVERWTYFGWVMALMRLCIEALQQRMMSNSIYTQ